MLGNQFQTAFHIPGTLAANIAIKWTAPRDCTLLEVCAVATNDSDATLIVGTSADDNGFITAATIGDSGTPNVFDKGDFDGALVSDDYPYIAADTIITADLDFDGAAGTAAANVTLVFTFLEG